MVRCCIDECNSRTKTSKDPPDLVMPSLHSFSPEKERRERWFINTGRKDLPQNPKLCDFYFDHNQKEIDLKVYFTLHCFHLRIILFHFCTIHPRGGTPY